MFPGRYGRRNVVNLVPVGGFVGSDSGCGRGLSCGLSLFVGCGSWWLLWCGLWLVWVTSPRPISTGRLGIAAVHLRPIDPVVCGWPYPIVWVGNLILKCASRLDAFSGYHVRT